MKKILISVILILAFVYSNAQKHPDFTIKYEAKRPSVKNQERTGTCWAFTTVSFVEAETLRKGKKEFDLSEMFIVRNVYPDKANRYVRLHGMGNFSQGGQAHDVTNSIREFGIVPESVYSGKKYKGIHNHYPMEKELFKIVDSAAHLQNMTYNWKKDFDKVINSYMGKPTKKFTYEGKEYTPKSFTKEVLDFNPDDYIEFTSYTHHPFYKAFDLEVPDNWSHDKYYNLPINELMEVMTYALENGYSIAWDGDVSESGFKHRSGKAELSSKELDMILNEGIQETRQETFDNFTTTDDHLMHITGIATDSAGNIYYQTKNSWGTESNEYGGYLYMSENFILIKTIAFMIHKDAIPKEIQKKIFTTRH